ncbi:MAG: type II secretion system protein GspD [Gammaproteobacteria bacterium]|nr:type II secretion system protein GspD [Gammaproteobacteria bacterium]
MPTAEIPVPRNSARRLASPLSLGLAALLTAVAISPLVAQPASGQRITPNFKDAEITQVIEAVAAATGRSIIVDPRVRAQVTMLSSTAMTPDAFYEAFLALLQVYGFVAVPSGNVLKIIPDANSRTMPGNDLPDSVSDTSDELVTQVVAVTNVSAAQLVAILRPLMPQNAHLAAYPASNTLILADRANNVNRMVRIIRRIDQASDADVEVVAMQNASASEVVRTMTALNPAQAQAEGGMAPLRVVADERSNSILLAGDKTQRLRARTLIAYLDTPLATGGDTRVRYLRYADAEKIAAKLKEQLGGAATVAGAPGAAAANTTTIGGGTTIWAEPETNALVITAPAKTMNSLMAVIDKLDIRRAQVIVEAIIVEVSADKSAELGVNWLVDGSKSDEAVGGFIEPIGGTSIVDLARAARDPATLTTIPRGTTVGVGRLASNGVNFAAVLRALRGDSTTNIIATPSIVTMDNQEAEIKVAQEVPFVTGQYTNSGGNVGNNLNPFQTIQRQEVGTILKITPQINEGDAVMLKIEQESSSIAATSSGAVDLVTNKRTISTNVLIEDGGTVVLGGLIQDSQTGGEQRVPFLGRIPLVGEAFRTRSAKKTKTNLMVFIQPRILRDGIDATIETNQKYNYIRDQQLKLGPQREVLPLLPGERRSILPAIPPAPAQTPAQTPVTEPPK